MATPIFGPENVDEFIALLQDADVLLYDSIGFEAGLVQWGDEAPVNHVALVISKGAQIIDADHRDGAVAVSKVTENFRLPNVRMVTALRHRGTSPGKDGQIIARARQDVGKATFDYRGLLEVGIIATCRTYPRKLREELGPAFFELLKHRVAWARKNINRDRCLLSCSEFVYRCFLESEARLAIDIPVPLVTVAANGLKLADESDWAGIEAARDYFELIRENNRRFRDDADLVPGDPLPDAVTPGDFWRSQSLEPVAVLQCTNDPIPRQPAERFAGN